MIERLSQIVDDGGAVAIALLVASVLMWSVVALRFRLLGRASDAKRTFAVGARRALIIGLGRPDQQARALQSLDLTVAQMSRRLSGWRVVLASLVATGPLLGLLGTVGGMIETFATLHLSGLAHADASVAGGIKAALLTTQLGLVVGVPGLVAARVLDRMEARRHTALEDARRQVAERLLARGVS